MIENVTPALRLTFAEVWLEGYATSYAAERGASGKIPHWTEVLTEGYSRSHAVHICPWMTCGADCLDCYMEENP